MATTIAAGNPSSLGATVNSDTTGVLQLQSGTSATTAITVDASQNVGIGTTTPSQKFDLTATGSANAILVAQNTTATSGGGQLRAGNPQNTFIFGVDTNSGGLTGTANSSFFYGGNAPIVFLPNGAEKMRLDTSGNLLVGITSAVGKATIQASSTDANQPALYLQCNKNYAGIQGLNVTMGNTFNDTGHQFISCTDGTPTLRFEVRSNGGIANYSANNVNLSDETVKKDITPAKNYLSILNQIPVVTFLLNDQTDTDLNLGVTAQSVKAVAPELVGTMNIGTEEEPNVKLAIYETDLKYAMLKAIQELSAQVTALQSDNAALKAKVGI